MAREISEGWISLLDHSMMANEKNAFLEIMFKT